MVQKVEEEHRQVHQQEQPIVTRKCGSNIITTNDDTKLPQPYKLSSQDEDYILTGGLEYDLNNPKYPLLEQNQDIPTFPASFGQVEYILDKYRENGEYQYDGIYSGIPKDMSYDNVCRLLKLNKIRSLSQQSPLN